MGFSQLIKSLYMKLTKYKETKSGVYERKVLWFESRIFGVNSKLRMFIRRKIKSL